MKRLLLIFITYLFSVNSIFSQQCLPDGIIFTSQDMIDNFQQNYPDCTEIQGNVVITNLDNLHITNLSGLSVITSIGGDLIVKDNPWLSNFFGLHNLSYLGGKLEVNNNGILTNFSAINNLNSIGGNLSIIDNGDLLNIDGLANITSVNGDLKVMGCHELLNLGGLSNLDSISGNFNITGNDDLLDLIGLGNLVYINGDFLLSYNYYLQNINALSQLTTINGNIDITSNWELENLTGLLGLNQINGTITIIDNNKLTSLHGLDNIDPNTIAGITIIFNNDLSTCEVESVCEYLSNPNFIASVGNNSDNCYTVQNIIEACMVGVDSKMQNNIELFPNPARTYICINNPDGLDIIEVFIYDNLGQKLFENSNGNRINISGLKKGVYIVEIVMNESISRRKLIVN